jgi:hypothetical protein
MSATDLTIMPSSSGKIYSAASIDEIIPRSWYIDHFVQVTTPYYARVPASKPSEHYILAQLKPLERWRYLARHNRGELIIWCLAFLGGTYMLIWLESI